MTRNGIDIRLAPIKDGVDTGVRYSLAYAEWEAATAAGLDLWSWESGRYPVRFMERVVAWWNLRNLVNTHGQDAVQRASERKGRRK